MVVEQKQLLKGRRTAVAMPGIMANEAHGSHAQYSTRPYPYSSTVPLHFCFSPHTENSLLNKHNRSYFRTLVPQSFKFVPKPIDPGSKIKKRGGRSSARQTPQNIKTLVITQVLLAATACVA